MKFIYTFGVASFDQIRRKFFAGRHPTAASGRISALRKAGFMQTFWHSQDGKPNRCVKLNKKAGPHLHRLWKERVEDPLFEVTSVEKALQMNDLAHRFEQLKMFKRMLSQQVIKGSSELGSISLYRNLAWQFCPGILEVEKDETQYVFPIEYEINTGAREFYQRKLRGYYEMDDISGAIFFCTSNETMDLVAEIDKEVRKDEDSVVYLALASSVIQAPDQIILESCSGQRIGFS